MLRFITVLMLSTYGMSVMAQAPSAIVPEWPAATGSAQALWLLGAADKQGIYAQRVRIPAGTTIAPHTHTDERFSVVISGTIYVGFGDQVDETKLVPIAAGEMYIAPAGVAHYVVAKDGDAEYQESGMGPSGTKFITAP